MLYFPNYLCNSTFKWLIFQTGGPSNWRQQENPPEKVKFLAYFLWPPYTLQWLHLTVRLQEVMVHALSITTTMEHRVIFPHCGQKTTSQCYFGKSLNPINFFLASKKSGWVISFHGDFICLNHTGHWNFFQGLVSGSGGLPAMPYYAVIKFPWFLHDSFNLTCFLFGAHGIALLCQYHIWTAKNNL